MQVLKRNVAVFLLAGLVLGGTAVAWAGGSPARPTVLAAAQAAGATTPSTGPAATPLTPAERQAKRAALKACIERAGEDTAARQACFAAAGLPKVGEHGPGHGGPGKPGGRLGGPGGLGALAKAVHGTVIVPGEGATWQTVTFDRGTVSDATDGSKIVLDRPDGVKVTIALTAATKYHGIADAAAIHKGKPAMVVSKDGKATQVVQRDPAHAKRPGTGNNGDAPVVPTD